MVKRLIDPLFLTNYTMVLGVDNYEAHFDTVRWNPSSSRQSWTGGDGNSYTASTVATWELELGAAQDWETDESASLYLHENEGEAVPAVFRPRSGTGPTVNATVTLTPGAIGGAINGFAAATVTLGSTRPVITPAA